MQLHFKSTSSQASGQYNCKLTRQGKVAKIITDYQCEDACLPLFSPIHVHLKSTESYEHQDKAKWSSEDMNAIRLVIWQGKITQNTLIFDMVLVRRILYADSSRQKRAICAQQCLVQRHLLFSDWTQCCNALQYFSVAILSMQCCQYSIGIAIKEPYSPWAQVSEIQCNLVQYKWNLTAILSNFVSSCCNRVQCQSDTQECLWRCCDSQLCIGVGDNAWIDRLLGGHLRQASERREINFKPIYTINSRDQS